MRFIRELPKLMICPTSSSSSSSIDIAPQSRTRSPWFSHKSTLRTEAMCLLANRIFVLSSQKHLGINLQAANTLFEKTPLPCHEASTQQGRSQH